MTSAAARGQFVISHYLVQSFINAFKMVQFQKEKKWSISLLVAVGEGEEERAHASVVVVCW